MSYVSGSEQRFASIAASSSGDNTLVAAVSGKRIKLVSFVFVAAGTVSVKFKSGASTDLSGAMPLAANGGVSGPSEVVMAQTAAGEALVLNLSGAVAVGGLMTYLVEAD